MFGDGSLTFREFVMREPLPLATIHDAVLEFLRGRTDAVLFGAHAVNAYVDEARMTQDVDILSTRAAELAEELRVSLSQSFQIAVRCSDGCRWTWPSAVPGAQAQKPSPRGPAKHRQLSAPPSRRQCPGDLPARFDLPEGDEHGESYQLGQGTH